MRLTVPAIRPAAEDEHRHEVSEHTAQLLEEIDALLAESEVTLQGPPGLHGRRAQPA